jgi:hypothetical protein
MILAGGMLLVKSETENLKSLLDSYHKDVAKKCITPKEMYMNGKEKKLKNNNY